MAYDLIHFARQMMGLAGHAELLEYACSSAAEISGQPTFAAHVLPGRDWETAMVLASGMGLAGAPAPVRSALFAVYRRLALKASALHLARDSVTEPVFRALLPAGPHALVAVPLRNRRGQLIGTIVTGSSPDTTAVAHATELESIAALTGPGLELAWRHTLARRDQERLHLLSETANESLWDWDLTLNEVWWGGSVEQLFGVGARVSKRADWRRARIHPEDVDRVIASFDAALASHSTSWSAEYRLRGIDDTVIDVREQVYFLREVDGRAHRAIGTVRDVRALQQLLVREKQARAEAERASMVKDEFLAMLGHELRNPLAPIIVVIELLERRSPGPDRQLEILRRQSQHLVRLVDDLLDVARISRGKFELARERTALEPLLTRAMEMARPLLEERRHELELDITKGLEVDVDSARLTQVLSNLLTNAAKYTEPGGRVRLSAHEESGQAVIRVRDNGIGIAREFLPRLFDMFAQGRQAVDRAQGGLGLGLSIVKNIVQLHGGSVEAHSEGVGRGSELVVRLPLPPAEISAPLSPAMAIACTWLTILTKPCGCLRRRVRMLRWSISACRSWTVMSWRGASGRIRAGR